MKHEINLNGKFNTNMIDEITNKKINKNLNIYISRQKEGNKKFSTIYKFSYFNFSLFLFY